MEKTIHIILGFHFHLPSGTRHAEYKLFYENRIKIILASLYQCAKIPAVLHFSGNLLYWIERNHPETFMLIKDMIKAKQIELLSGGFYEPLMPILQHPDRVGQIEMLSTYIRRSFGKRTYGCWLPDVSWDQSMVSVLSACNIAWTFLDEKRFIELGLNGREPCISEDKGKTVIIFPHAKEVRNLFEQTSAAEALNQLMRDVGKQAQSGGEQQTFSIFPRFFSKHDSCEKLDEAAVSNFFEEASRDDMPIEWALPSKAAKSCVISKRAYFVQKNVKQFLIEYPQANMIYAKLIFTRSLVDQLKGDKIRKQRAQEEIWKAQVYNLFTKNDVCEEETAFNRSDDGIVAINKPELRAGAYQSMLTAEKITRETRPFVSAIMNFDYTFDGEKDYLYQSEHVNCYIKRQGACVFEIDFLPKSTEKTWNYLNTLFDGAETRYTFADCIADPAISAEDLAANAIGNARLVRCEMFEQLEMERAHGKLKLRCPEKTEGPFGAIALEKFYHLKENKFTVYYKLVNTGSEDLSFVFIPEINFSFYSNSDDNLRLNAFEEFKTIQDHSEKIVLPSGESLGKKTIHNIKAVNFEDLYNEAIINICCDDSFDALIYHETEADVYQSTRILPQKKIALSAAASVEFSFQLGVYHQSVE